MSAPRTNDGSRSDADAMTDDEPRDDTDTTDTSPAGLPTYVKVLLALTILAILFIIVLDMLVIAGNL